MKIFLYPKDMGSWYGSHSMAPAYHFSEVPYTPSLGVCHNLTRVLPGVILRDEDAEGNLSTYGRWHLHHERSFAKIGPTPGTVTWKQSSAAAGGEFWIRDESTCARFLVVILLCRSHWFSSVLSGSTDLVQEMKNKCTYNTS